MGLPLWAPTDVHCVCPCYEGFRLSKVTKFLRLDTSTLITWRLNSQFTLIAACQSAFYETLLAFYFQGAQVDRMETDLSVEEARNSLSCKQDLESEEFCALLQQQKYLSNLTSNALRKNQPLLISNLMHEKVPLLVAEDLGGASKLEKMCLQALSMRAFPCGPPIEISMDNMQADDQNACLSNSKASATPVSTVMVLQHSDMPIIVSYAFDYGVKNNLSSISTRSSYLGKLMIFPEIHCCR